MKLENKHAVVTGASSHGIGRAIAEAFIAQGAHVATIDKRPSPDQTSGDHGQNPLNFQSDVSDPSQLVATLEQVKDQFGKIDILVNAAGITHRKPFLEVSVADWDEVHDVNLRAYFVATQWLARDLISRNTAGSIINVASINGRGATAGQSHYCAAKSGVIMLTKAAALELASYGIRVNSLSPGVIETDFNRDLLSGPEFRSMRTSAIPMGRIGEPGEVAPAAVLLASDDGSFITGADYVIDGGQTAGNHN